MCSERVLLSNTDVRASMDMMFHCDMAFSYVPCLAYSLSHMWTKYSSWMEWILGKISVPSALVFRFAAEILSIDKSFAYTKNFRLDQNSEKSKRHQRILDSCPKWRKYRFRDFEVFQNHKYALASSTVQKSLFSKTWILKSCRHYLCVQINAKGMHWNNILQIIISSLFVFELPGNKSSNSSKMRFLKWTFASILHCKVFCVREDNCALHQTRQYGGVLLKLCSASAIKSVIPTALYNLDLEQAPDSIAS